MGTNYYLVNKKEYEDEKKFRKIIDDQIDKVEGDSNTLFDSIKDSILKVYGPITNELKKEKYDEVLEKFDQGLDEAISKLVSDLRYDINYTFDVSERHSKHIGKSSIGWLFNFQYQDEWKSYNEFKAYITNKEKMKDQTIVDEYGEEITPEGLLDLIDAKQNDERNQKNPDNFTYNDNIDGYRFSKGDFS